MSNVFTLDSLREEVEKESAPVKIGLKDGTEVVLQNLLRLGKTDRNKAIELISGLEGLDKIGEDTSSLESVDEMITVVHELLVLVAKSGGKKLVTELGEDLGLTMAVVTKWMETTQPGEADSSLN